MRRNSTPDESRADLGVLSIHLYGGRCRVACPFCYLGRRTGSASADGPIDLGVVREALLLLPYDEVAVALSEPVAPALLPLQEIAGIAARRGRLLTVTTTVEVALDLPAETLCGVGRLSLSIDPWKGAVLAAEIGPSVAALRARLSPGAEIVLIVTLSTPAFARSLLSGLLADLLSLPVDRVALSALKPPPSFCDRAFWLRAMAKLAPLLRQHLGQRLFLDCYVAARILQLGPCPARPDLSPSGDAAASGAVAFRSCVYQAAPDFSVGTGEELARRLRGFVAPENCPFPIE